MTSTCGGCYRKSLTTRCDVPTKRTMDEWLSTLEAARRLGVRSKTLAGFIGRGELPACRFGRLIRIRESDLADFIEACRIEPGLLGTGD